MARRSGAVFEVFEDFELGVVEGFFEAVGEADEEFLAGDGRGAGDNADGAARVDEGMVSAAHFDEGNDLRSGKDVVRLVRHGLVSSSGGKHGGQGWEREGIWGGGFAFSGLVLSVTMQ